MVVSVESSDKHDVNTLKRLHRRGIHNNRGVTLPSIAQNISKRTTGNDETNARTGGIRSHVIVRRYDQRNTSGMIQHTHR